MKIVKSNSKTQYNFCGTSKLSFKQRVLAGNSFVPTKFDMSTDLRDPGNSYVEEKQDMSKSEENKQTQKQPQQPKQSQPQPQSVQSEPVEQIKVVGVRKPITFGTLVKGLNNLGKSDFSKSDVKYDQGCLDNYEEIGIPRDEAKKKRYGCQINSSGKPWEKGYDDLDKEVDKFEKESRKSAKSSNLKSKPKVETLSSPVGKKKMDDLFADMDNTVKQHCGNAQNCRVSEANGQRSVTAWN